MNRREFLRRSLFAAAAVAGGATATLADDPIIPVSGEVLTTARLREIVKEARKNAPPDLEPVEIDGTKYDLIITSLRFRRVIFDSENYAVVCLDGQV